MLNVGLGVYRDLMRKLREIDPNVTYHVISRFVGQQWFIRGEPERYMYLTLLGLALAQTEWTCFAFAIMSNHIHLALRSGTDALASWLRPFHTDFAQWINEREQRIGAVFVRGPNVIRVEEGGGGRLISYIHNNPVRAGIAATADESSWTSHRAYLGTAYRPAWLDVSLGLALGGFEDGAAFGAWSRMCSVTREDLAGVSEPQRRVGRPRKMGSDPISAQLLLTEAQK